MESSCTVVETVNVPAAQAFAVAVPVDLTKVMRARWPIAAVSEVKDQTGAWDGAGQSRRVFLADGSSAHEELTSYEPARRFSYRVSDFKGPFGALVAEARGTWRFTALAPDKTRIAWTYSFRPRSLAAAVPLAFIVSVFWRGYIGAALKRVKALAEEKSRAP